MATTKAAKGFRASCPFCGTSDENCLNLDLNRLDVVLCGSCDESFSPEQALAKATETMAAWERIVKMVTFGRELAAE
jgi:transcription elongation factor Elf1